MRKIIIITLIFITLVITSCKKNPVPENIDFKQEMRQFVSEISSYAKGKNPNFAIIPQNGANLVSLNGEENGSPNQEYINVIDGIGQEDLYYGYKSDDKETPSSTTSWLKTFLDMAKNNGTVKILVTDYCSTHSKMDNSYSKNKANGFLSFSANHRGLDNIPNYPTSILNENSDVITNLQEAKNFLYLISPDNEYSTPQEFVDAVRNTNYDLIIMDYFFAGKEFTAQQILQLKQKANGGKRLIISYMSIGESEDYRYYWNSDWKKNPPTWLEKENPNWEGNYKVRYWEQEWKDIIVGKEDSYLTRIVDAGFDGVYLDIIDAFEYFE